MKCTITHEAAYFGRYKRTSGVVLKVCKECVFANEV